MTYRLFGGINRSMIWQMLHLCRFTGQYRIFILSVIMIGFTICIPIVGLPIPSGVLAMMSSSALVPLFRLTLPPAVLFLGGSSERATSLFFLLQRVVNPYRVVALLDPRGMGVFGHLMRLDIMRTSAENTWKSMIHRLIEIAPCFVIDTVHRTGPVRYEVFLMLSPERAARIVFISDKDGSCPSLLDEGINPYEHAIPVTDLNDLGRTVDNLLRTERIRIKTRTFRSQENVTVIPDTFESLPSVLMIALTPSGGLDGRFILDQARDTDKEIISFLLPLSSVNHDAAMMSVDLSWDFSRNPHLVGLYLEDSGIIMVRRDFLLKYPNFLHFQVPGTTALIMSFEDLNKPEPIGAALNKLCREWKKTAEQNGQEFRFAMK